jgi:hypothetical protein
VDVWEGKDADPVGLVSGSTHCTHRTLSHISVSALARVSAHARRAAVRQAACRALLLKLILKCGAFCVRHQTSPTHSQSSRQQNTKHGPQPARSNHTARLLGTDLARNRVKVTLALRCDPTPVRGKGRVSGDAHTWAGQKLNRHAPVQYAPPSGWQQLLAATPLPSWHVSSCWEPHPLPRWNAKASAWLFPAIGCCI